MFITLFCTFFSCRCMAAMWNFPIYAPVSWSIWTWQKFPLFFLNLDTFLSISNWIRSMKVETVQPHFLSNVFSLSSSRSFATMTRWCNNFSPLMTKDNCNGLFFGRQMHLEKNPWLFLWRTPQLRILCLHMGKNTYCSSLSCFNCLSNLLLVFCS